MLEFSQHSPKAFMVARCSAAVQHCDDKLFLRAVKNVQI